MQAQKRLICDRTESLSTEINAYLNCLYGNLCPQTRFFILNQVKSKMQELSFLRSLDCVEEAKQTNLPTQISISQEQLAQSNGTQGRPAYVAVNGTVYDVTNNAAWAAATHFGLTAGRDLTQEFAGCHPDQSILNSLTVVGKLIQ